MRAEPLCYVLAGRAGQTLTLAVRSPDGNVAVAVYVPGFKVTRASDGPGISGATLPGAGDQDEAKVFSARLPVSGRYLLVLGTTRGGGGQFRMDVGVR